MRGALANLIWLLHIAFVVFVVATPFVGNQELQTLYVATIPFVCLHWLYNNDTCILTLFERTLRGVDDNNSFFHALLSPVYKPDAFSDASLKKCVWLCTIVLWLIAMRSLKKKNFAFAKTIVREMTGMFTPRS